MGSGVSVGIIGTGMVIGICLYPAALISVAAWDGLRRRRILSRLLSGMKKNDL